jgi:acyl carrier protein
MPPIGRPMPGHSAYVLDGGLRLVPAGAPGELCIGGAGLARGYLGRPDQTAERFVPDPFGEPGARLYRTGDRAYRLPSGELQLLGRIDRQVKVRGHRVELGEVESAIGRLEGVRQVAVEAPPDEAGRPQLVAYLAGDWSPDVSELRARLEAELPGYMLPSRVVHLERLPLTSRGKVDRAALPAPAAGTDGSEAAVAPRTWIEERIAGAVVGPLLQAGSVDVERNFFELGGNSLEAIQVVSRAAEAFAVEIDLGEFLAEPTVRRLGQLVEAAQAAAAEAGDLLLQIVEEVEALSEEEAERLLAGLDEQRGG